MSAQPSITDEELLRLFDGELADDEARTVQARLSNADRETLARWQRQKEQLQAWGQSLATETIPAHLHQAARRTARTHDRAQRWQRWGGMAASVAIAFGMGWQAHGLGHFPSEPSAVQPEARLAGETGHFQLQATLAHATFTPEVRHPVEVGADQQTHLVQWLSKRLGRTLKVPNLSAQHFELVGGRLLPGDAGARAQLMFQHPNGTRATLYLGALAANAQDISKETAFAFSEQEKVASFYWVDEGFGYALSAPLPKNELWALVQMVHQQL